MGQLHQFVSGLNKGPTLLGGGGEGGRGDFHSKFPLLSSHVVQIHAEALSKKQRGNNVCLN